MSSRRLVVEADGGSRGNPGPAGYGAVVRDGTSGDVLAEVAESLGRATNNVAEYSGLLAGLRAAAEIDPDAAVEVRMDSKLVVEQMSGRWKIKHDDMRRLAVEARRVLPTQNVSYTWVPRSQNAHADRLANEAMDAAARGEVWTRRNQSAETDDARDDARGDDVRLAVQPADRYAGDGAAADDDVPPVAQPADGYAGDIEPREAYRLLAAEPGAVLVDCRTEAEWAYVGVPDLSGLGKQALRLEWLRYPDGAVNEHFVDELRRIGVDEGRPLVFLCRSGVRSVAAARAATNAGLGPAYNVLEGFEGGLDEQGHRGRDGWRARGLPWRQS